MHCTSTTALQCELLPSVKWWVCMQNQLLKARRRQLRPSAAKAHENLMIWGQGCVFSAQTSTAEHSRVQQSTAEHCTAVLPPLLSTLVAFQRYRSFHWLSVFPALLLCTVHRASPYSLHFPHSPLPLQQSKKNQAEFRRNKRLIGLSFQERTGWMKRSNTGSSSFLSQTL